MKEAIIFLCGWMGSTVFFEFYAGKEIDAGYKAQKLETQCKQKHNVNKCYLVATPEEPNE